jgi:hypothetical protein
LLSVDAAGVAAGAAGASAGLVVGEPQPTMAKTPKLQTNINIAANFFISTPFEFSDAVSHKGEGPSHAPLP